MRPGPIQGNMVHPYLRRRNGEEAVTYPNEVVRRVLEKTLGVPLFQEQAMRLAVEAAGFTPGEADQLRRAMGAWRRPGLIDQFRKKLVAGMLAKGFTPPYAEAVFTQIRGFGDYGFPESHAASFALLVYVAAWLKHHYPAALTAALLNSQPMGFYAPAQLVRNACEHGVEVLPVDVNHSDWDCTIEKAEGGGGTAEITPHAHRLRPVGTEAAGDVIPGARSHRTQPVGLGDLPCPSSSFPLPPSPFRLGFRMLSGLARTHAQRIVEARGGRPFRSLDEFARRTGLSRAVLVRLAKAGAFGSLGLDRRGALWHALAEDQRNLPLFDRTDSTPSPSPFRPPPSPLSSMSPAEEVLADYRAAGLSLRGHPMEFLRAGLDAMQVTPAAGLRTWPDGRPVQVAGIVLVRQRPSTAKGITFVTLEDETGTANLIVRPAVWQRYRRAAAGATLLLAGGPLQRQGEIIHVLVERLEDLSARLQALGPQSRDFC